MNNNQVLGMVDSKIARSLDLYLSPERRCEIEAAYVRKDVDALRQSFASNDEAISEYAERLLEQALDEIRSERDRKDALFLKTKPSLPFELDSALHFCQF